MALLLTQTLPSGLQISYWRISSITIDRLNQFARVNLVSYKDQASRQANMDTVSNYNLLVNDPDQLLALITSPNLLTAAYDLIKALPDFAGSTDLI